MKAKKNLKRLLSILLYSLMLVGLFTMTAFAEGATPINVSNSEELSDAINRINADNTGRVKFVGRWEFVAKEVPGTPTTPSTPATPTTPADPTTPAETNSGTGVTNPQTGDNSCLVLWITLFVASVFGIAGIAGIAVCSRRKRVR